MLEAILFLIINIIYISLIVMGFYFKMKDLVDLIKSKKETNNIPNNTVNCLNHIEKSLCSAKDKKVNYKL